MPSEFCDNQSTHVVITGATSLIGHFLLSRLRTAGYSQHAISRSQQKTSESGWHTIKDSLKTTTPPLDNADVLIHLGPLRILPDLLDDFAILGGKRLIAFSSTSRFSKLKSGSLSERTMAQELIAAEEVVTSQCDKLGIHWTIFRPTLIYGAGLDKNVSSITRFIKRFSFFPLVGKGSGLRQPVHADDLATACLNAIKQQQTYNKAYDLVGGETLTYKEMVERIFNALNKTPRFIAIPLPLFRVAMKCISFFPRYSHLTPDMADRMNHPLCFNSDAAKKDFGYKNRGFTPLQEDLDPKLSYARL